MGPGRWKATARARPGPASPLRCIALRTDSEYRLARTPRGSAPVHGRPCNDSEDADGISWCGCAPSRVAGRSRFLVGRSAPDQRTASEPHATHGALGITHQVTAERGVALYDVAMHTQLKRTYVVYRSTFWERPYQALGTVVAPTHVKAQEIARRRWRIPVGDMFHTRAAGSVAVALLLEALTKDGEGASRRKGGRPWPPELPE